MTQEAVIPTHDTHPTMEIEVQNIWNRRGLENDDIFDSIRQKTPVIQKSPPYITEATLNMVGRQRGKRAKPVRVAIQILQQEIKQDKIRYFMRWENPNAERSWCWAEDVNEDLKRTFYTNNPLEVTPEIMSISDNNKTTFLSHSCNGEVMSH